MYNIRKKTKHGKIYFAEKYGREGEGKSRGMWQEVCWRRDPEQAQEDFGRKSARQNIWKVREIDESAGGKGSKGMWNETQAKKIRQRGNRKE